MTSIHIKRISDDNYAVRQFDTVLSVDLGQMSEKKLRRHLTVRGLMDRTPNEVLNLLLKVDDEITVHFRTPV